MTTATLSDSDLIEQVIGSEVNRTAIVAGHQAALAGRNFTVRRDFNLTRVESVNTVNIWISQNVLRVSGDRQRISLDYTSDVVVFRDNVNDYSSHQASVIYEDSSLSYKRELDGEYHLYVGELGAGESGYTVSNEVNKTLSMANFSVVGVEEYHGMRVVNLSATTEDIHPESFSYAPSEFRTTILVDGAGIVRRIHWFSRTEGSGQETTTLTISGIGTTTVQSPTWLPEAQQELGVQPESFQNGRLTRTITNKQAGAAVTVTGPLDVVVKDVEVSKEWRFAPWSKQPGKARVSPIVTVDGLSEVENFTITMAYNESDLPPNTTESGLEIFIYHPENQIYFEMETTVDAANDTVTTTRLVPNQTLRHGLDGPVEQITLDADFLEHSRFVVMHGDTYRDYFKNGLPPLPTVRPVSPLLPQRESDV